MHDLCDQGDHHELSDSDHLHGNLHGHLHAINGHHPHNIPDHIYDNHCDQGDLHEPSDSDYEHNNARSPRQEAALLEVCESRHLADDDDLAVDDDLEEGGRGRVMIMTKVH